MRVLLIEVMGGRQLLPELLRIGHSRKARA
jgi:hypothetical protein